jgi:hypothetical protein
MAGAANSPTPEAVQDKKSVSAAPASVKVSAPSAPPSFSVVEEQKGKIDAPAAHVATIGNVDRAAIARVVENVLLAQGIARGSGAPKFVPAVERAATELASPSSIAAEIADRFFASSANPNAEVANTSFAVSPGTNNPNAPVPSSPAPDAGKKSEPAAKAAIEIQVFVSENDVRRAMTRSEKIFIGRKTILTPSARDLGLEHEVFVETEAGSIR